MNKGTQNCSGKNLSDHAAFLRNDNNAVTWRIEPGQIGYLESCETMRNRSAAISNGEANECVWLVQHPPVYTAGTSAQVPTQNSTQLLTENNTLNPQSITDRASTTRYVAPSLPSVNGITMIQTGRGGKHTYHGPGQRVGYVMLDLKHRKRDVRAFIAALERWIINALDEMGVGGFTRQGRIGVWVTTPARSGGFTEKKIAALGVRLSRWVSSHGISINVDCDLSHFDGIVPCGISEFGVTSLRDLGFDISMDQVDLALKHTFVPIFGPIDTT